MLSTSARWGTTRLNFSILALVAIVASVILPAAPASAEEPARVIYVDARDGNDKSNGKTPNSAVQTVEAAQKLARVLAAKGNEDVVVTLAAGEYRLSKPLVFDARDSGVNGHTVRWEGPLSGGQASIMGSSKVGGWKLSDAANGIYSAAVPKGTESRQLYVDGVLAQRAQTTLNRADMVATSDGYRPQGSAAWLLTMSGIANAEIAGAGAWTSRFSPIDGVQGDLLMMQQPAWKLNTWGWDTLNAPFHNGPLVVENALALLDSPGEWYLDSAAGRLYYKPLAGQQINKADVELPLLETLVQVAGTLDAPVHNLAFSNLGFSGTTWNEPTHSGYADQQTGSYVKTLDGIDLANFESTRSRVSGMPAGIQVSAAHDISFSDSTFTNFGANGIGIGNDANAMASGVGLAAQNISVSRSVLTQIAGSGIAAGGYLPDAHHPSDPRMVVSNIEVSDNVIHDVARYYTDSVGVLMTYVSDSKISHNEIFELPYSAIAIGYGWGIPDAGGSPEYLNRGTYNYYPLYTTPTTLKNMTVDGNYVHDVLGIHTDGAPFYSLGAAPGSVIQNNYIADSPHFGLYFDEGTRYIRTTNNVVTTTGGRWWHANYANSPLNGNMVTDGNFSNTGSNNSDPAGRNDIYTNNSVVPDQNWSPAARAIVYNAGVPQELRVGAASRPSALYISSSQELSSNAGQPVTFSTVIGNASGSTVSNLTATVESPEGWTSNLTGLPSELGPGATATVSVNLVPESSPTADAISKYNVAVTIDYQLEGRAELAVTTLTTVVGAPIVTPLVGFTTSASGVTGQREDELAIRVAGADIWGAGGQRDDQYGTIYQPQSLSDQGSVTAFLDSQEAANQYTKSGVVIRNDLTGAGSSKGYASLYRLAGHGVALAIDSNGDGYIDVEYRQSITTTGTLGMKLTRGGTNVSAYISEDGGTTWKQVGTSRPVVGANTVVDAGVIHTSHDAARATTATFHGLTITNQSNLIVSAPTAVGGSNGTVPKADLVIRNIGTAEISSLSANVNAPDGWSVDMSALPTSIAAGGSAAVSATFAPPTGQAVSAATVGFDLTYTSDGNPGATSWSPVVNAGLALPSEFSGFTTSPTGVVGSSGQDLAIRVAGADIWGAGGQRDDAYGAIFQKGAIEGDGSVTARLDSQEAANQYTKSGLVLRNDLTAAGSAKGYATLYRLAGFGVALAVDTNGDGMIDAESRLGGITSGPIELRLVRTGDTVSGFVSQDNAATWTQVGSARALVGANAILDAGLIHTSHDAQRATTAHFSGLVVVR